MKFPGTPQELYLSAKELRQRMLEDPELTPLLMTEMTWSLL